MTSRERVLTALEHKLTDRVPFTWGNGIADETLRLLSEYLHIGSIQKTYAALTVIDDIGDIYPNYIGPDFRHRYGDDGLFLDEWGVKWKIMFPGQGGRGDPIWFPLADAETVEEINAYHYPSPEWFDYEQLNEQIDRCNANGEKAIRFSNANPFEIAGFLRGYENLFVDTYENPEIVHALMRKATDYFRQYMTCALEATKGKIDIVITADDLGGQNGLLLSPAAISEFILPYHKEVNDIIHSYGVKVMYHSCGSVIKAVDLLIASGVDVLESIQLYTAGMTPEALKDGFGDRICFQGGASVQKTLVSGSPEDVKQEAGWLLRTLGCGGGYILAPAHHVQYVPPENILALIEAAGRKEEFFANVNQYLRNNSEM